MLNIRVLASALLLGTALAGCAVEPIEPDALDGFDEEIAFTEEAIVPNECSTGPIQCCNTLWAPTASNFALLSALFGVSLPTSTDGRIGLNCTPTNTLGIGGGNACTEQPVCCKNNALGGLVNLQCHPVSINP